ncbi:MAG: hypothetical protein AB7F25_12295 [Deferribacterales bacterium]
MTQHAFNIADYPVDFAKFKGIVEALARVMRDPHSVLTPRYVSSCSPAIRVPHSVPTSALVMWFIYWSACSIQNRKVCKLNIIDNQYLFYDFIICLGLAFPHCKNITYLRERQYCRSIADVEIIGDWADYLGIIEFGADEFVCLRTYLRCVSTNDIPRSYSHDDSYLDVVEHLKSQPSVFA